jgi:CBS domain-containing protein
MRVADVMTRDVAVVRPDDAIRHAAQKMDELNVGVLPVCKGRRLVGMITDRDITVRATAAGRLPHEAKVEDAMSGDVRWCFEDASTAEVLDMMRQVQIRRVPVIDRDKNLVGLVTLGDLATEEVRGADIALRDISQPSRPDR